MFLHEIFHQGLQARIANWPTLVLGELPLPNTHTLTVGYITRTSGAFDWTAVDSRDRGCLATGGLNALHLEPTLPLVF